MPPEVRVIGIEGMPEFKDGDDLARPMMDAAQAQGTAVEAGDILLMDTLRKKISVSLQVGLPTSIPELTFDILQYSFAPQFYQSHCIIWMSFIYTNN